MGLLLLIWTAEKSLEGRTPVIPVQPRTAWLRDLLNCQFIAWVVTTLVARMDLRHVPLDKQGLGKRPWSGLSSNQQGCACLPRLGLHRMAQRTWSRKWRAKQTRDSSQTSWGASSMQLWNTVGTWKYSGRVCQLCSSSKGFLPAPWRPAYLWEWPREAENPLG